MLRRPWAPDLRQSERGPTEADDAGRLDAAPGWLPAAHSAVCSRHAGLPSTMGTWRQPDGSLHDCAQQSSQNPRDSYLPMVPNTHTTNASVLHNVSTVQEGPPETSLWLKHAFEREGVVTDS